MRNLPNYQPQNDEEPHETPAQELQRAPNPRPETRNKGVNIIVKLLLCLYIIDTIPLVEIIIFKQEGDKQQIEGRMFKSLQSMSTNIKADPIMEIQIINHGSACPSDFQALKLANWPGTVAGCLCENGDLHDTSCEIVDSEKCKTDVSSTYPIDMYEWEYSLWCVKRAVLGTDYLRKAECPIGYKECYPGGCFKGDCPISKVEIVSAGVTNKLNTGQDKYVITTRTQGASPLINIQITLGDFPCFSQGLFNKTIKNSSYELTTVKETLCDKYGLNSQFSTKLDSQTAFQAFTQNYFSYSVMSLPHFEENANSTIALLSSMVRMKTAKNDYCLNIDEKFATNYINASEGQFHFIPFSGIVACLIMSLIMFCSLIFESHTHSPEDNKLAITVLFWIHFMSCIFIIVELGTFPRIHQSFQPMKAEIEMYHSFGCFGDPGSLVISDYLQIFRKIEARFWAYFVLIPLGGLHILIVIAFYFVKKRTFSRQY